ncbi:MAG: hypothetical protein LBV03_07090 [Fusobacteriales bacterium]|jgi:uncharacterized protein YceK|nr:hypothetical protein [Fusobacteriales bacterium]
MKNIILITALLAGLASCSSVATDKTNQADYNRGYNKNCNYQYGEDSSNKSNCSADTF